MASWTGYLLKLLRTKFLGLTQDQMAQELSCHRTSIVTYERAPNTPISGTVAVALNFVAQKKGVSIPQLLEAARGSPGNRASVRVDMSESFHLTDQTKPRAKDILQKYGSASTDGAIDVAFIYYPSGATLISDEASDDQVLSDVVNEISAWKSLRKGLDGLYHVQQHFTDQAPGPGRFRSSILLFSNWVLTVVLGGKGNDFKHALIAVTKNADEYQHVAVTRSLEAMTKELSALSTTEL